MTERKPDFGETLVFVSEKFGMLRTLYPQWAHLGRCAIQGLPYDALRLAELEASINTLRNELRPALMLASEYFHEEQLELLRERAIMSKYAWRTLKKRQAVTLKNGFHLVSF